MTSRRLIGVATVGILLAAVVALPGPAAGAQPNQLHSPSVTPRAGAPTTAFTFSVAYEGRDRAVSVVATVAERTVNLALVSSTATSGTFGGTAQLPAGTWPVTFMVGGIGMITLLVIVALVAGARDRRREKARQAAAATAARQRRGLPEHGAQAHAPALWEVDAELDEVPIGTVEFLPLEAVHAIAPQSHMRLLPASGSKRLNPRMARIDAARWHSPASRRNALEGS